MINGILRDLHAAFVQMDIRVLTNWVLGELGDVCGH